jgi:predicted ribosome quality control (RQC) complex YloA/Tae2 family protein
MQVLSGRVCTTHVLRRCRQHAGDGSETSMVAANSRNPDNHARLIQYTLPGGWKVLAGRTDADNDRLSLNIAKPDDWWFHVRGMPGSHVLLRARPGDDPDRATLKRAAAIAAYHSKARTAGLVAVSCTRARYVTKPPGAKPGTVEIRKEIILKVRPEPPEAWFSGKGSHPHDSS